MVLPAPLLSAPSVVEVRVTLPPLPSTRAVTAPLPRSPEAAVAATEVPLPRLAPGTLQLIRSMRSDEHTSELQSLMRISYAVFCFNKHIISHYASCRVRKHTNQNSR